MKRHATPWVLSVVSCLVLVTILGAPLLQSAPAGAAQAAPQVAVYLKNYLQEYDFATTEFLAAQFDNLDSPAYGLVSYTIVTTLTQGALSGSSALIIDESADMSLNASEAALIHGFASRGGRIGLFTFPRYYWDHEGPNPAAFQSIADLFGSAVVGQPDEIELGSGDSSAEVSPAGCALGLCFTEPYSVTGALVMNYDKTPFTPIVSTGATPILTSPAFDGAAVAVATSHGLLVTNPIGDMVQGGDANLAYRQFVADAIVWLADPQAVAPNKTFLPTVRRL
jgi:hypothetical protein